MSTSVRFPFRPERRGGLAKTPVDQPSLPLRQAVVISLIGAGPTRHPWDRAAGLFDGSGAAYRTNREGDTIRSVERRFEQLRREGRAQLLERPKAVMTGDGRRTVTFSYIDLETGETFAL